MLEWMSPILDRFPQIIYNKDSNRNACRHLYHLLYELKTPNAMLKSFPYSIKSICRAWGNSFHWATTSTLYVLKQEGHDKLFLNSPQDDTSRTFQNTPVTKHLHTVKWWQLNSNTWDILLHSGLPFTWKKQSPATSIVRKRILCMWKDGSCFYQMINADCLYENALVDKPMKVTPFQK